MLLDGDFLMKFFTDLYLERDSDYNPALKNSQLLNLKLKEVEIYCVYYHHIINSGCRRGHVNGIHPVMRLIYCLNGLC